MVEQTVRGNLPLGSGSQIDHVQIIPAHKCDARGIGRKLRHLLRPARRKPDQPVFFPVVDPILGSKRPAVDRFYLRSQQNTAFIRTECIIGERQYRLLLFAVEHHSGLLSGPIAEFEDFPVAHGRVMLSVVHAAYALYGAGHENPLLHVVVTEPSRSGNGSRRGAGNRRTEGERHSHRFYVFHTVVSILIHALPLQES